MLLTLRVTEERKRTSSVTTYRAPHIHTDCVINDQGAPIADQLTTTLHGRLDVAVEAANAILAC
jgi:hypothetical protein